MELKAAHSSGSGRWTLALFLASIYAVILGTVGAMELLPLTLLGAAMVLWPKGEQRLFRILPLVVPALWLLLRFRPIADGAMVLANRLFARSQKVQAYEYDFLPAKGDSAWEAALWLALLMGWLCRRWGRGVGLGLCALWAGAMAYFGVTPGIWTLAAALFCGLLTALPPKGRWLSGILVGALVLGLAAASLKFAPEPIPAVSRLDEELRDALAFQTVSMEQTPVPTQVPEPEILPPEQVERERPDHGVQGRLVNVLFLALAALTLAILFVPAVIRDRAAKRAEQNRTGLRSPDPAEAIRAMYLYAMRWRELDPAPEPVPEEIYGIWQEAAFSPHPMEEGQREAVREYLEGAARSAWDKAGRRLRMKIRYGLCL